MCINLFGRQRRDFPLSLKPLFSLTTLPVSGGAKNGTEVEMIKCVVLSATDSIKDQPPLAFGQKPPGFAVRAQRMKRRHPSLWKGTSK
jgi:hypothetical protein